MAYNIELLDKCMVLMWVIITRADLIGKWKEGRESHCEIGHQGKSVDLLVTTIYIIY